MARTPDSKRVSKWQERVKQANKTYDEWSDRFKCDLLEDYYAGFQWQDDEEHYTINLIFPTVEVRLPSLMFRRPKANFRMVPYREDDEGSGIEARTELIASVADHFVTRQGTDFRPETLMATKEALYRFGIIETCYSANFADNPNVGKPVLNEDGKELKDENGNTITETDKTIESERLYVKRVPAKRFRVPQNHTNRLEKNDWCGYYEWMWPSDIKANPSWKNLNKVKVSGFLPGQEVPDSKVEGDRDERHDGMVKVWKIWDLRQKKKYVFPEDGDYFFVDGEAFKYHPFSVLKFHELLDSFYPVPYLFNLLSPQDELNETREMQRVHRKRFARRYLVRKNAIDTDELRKLRGPAVDGEVITVEGSVLDTFAPLPDAPLDRAVAYNLPTTHDDFIRISAIGGEARGIPDAETATQAQIIDQGNQTRDHFTRDHVAAWLSDIIRNIVKSCRDNMTKEFYVAVNVDPFSEKAAEQAMAVTEVWKTIDPDKIGEIEFEVSIDVETLAPPNKQLQKSEWLEAFGVIFANPQALMILANSPYLLKRTLSHYNITNGKDIMEIFRAVQGVAMHMMAAQGGNPQNAAQAGVAGPSGMVDQAPPALQQLNAATGRSRA